MIKCQQLFYTFYEDRQIERKSYNTFGAMWPQRMRDLVYRNFDRYFEQCLHFIFV